MLASVYAKAVRDRWVTTAVGAVTLASFLLMGMAVYREIDLSIYTNLPVALRDIMGIPAGADAASLAYGAIYASYGALTLGAIAISLGAGAIAGEERDGTLGLLLSAPRSRRRVLTSKAASIVTLSAAACVLLLGAGYATPAFLGVDIGETHLVAGMTHLFVNTLFYGALALAIGAWTGRRALASGTAGGVMALSFVFTGLLPLVEPAADLVRLLPWYYYAGSSPLQNGVAPGHLAVLLVATATLTAAAFVGLDRRDLRAGNGGTSLVERLREHPLTRRAVERLAGGARVSRIWIKTASEHQGLLLVVVLTMFGMMGVLMGPMYAAIDDTLASFTESMPDVLLAIAGGGDVGTPEGWYQLETFGLMAPAAVMAVAVTVGARALAGEEQRRTMSLLLANPITRTRVVLEKTVTMVLLSLVVGASTWAGVTVGSVISGLGMSPAHIASTSLLSVLLGLVFGGVALALGAATGRTRIAVYGTVGLALLAYLADSLFPLADSLAGWSRWSPFHYYLSSDPLNTGMHWGHAGLLLALFATTIAASVVLFERRDLRQG